MMQTTKKTFPKYPAYKDSGVEWLGEIPENWELRRFKYLFKEINERSNDGSEDLLSVSQYTGVTKKSDKVEDGDLLTTASTLEGYKKVNQDDLVINIMLAWNGSLGFSPYDGITSPAYSIYRLNNGNSERFFHYLVRSQLYKSEFKRNSSGVIESRLRLYTDDFFAIWSLLPPLPEQTAIAAFLDDKTTKIDRAIAQKEKMIALLKERKQIIIQNAVTKGLDPNVKLKDSGVEWIGEIPEHYSMSKLGLCVNPVSIKNRSDLPLLSITRELGVIVRDVEDQESNHNFIPDDLSGYKVIRKGQFGMNKMKAWQGSYGVSKYDGIISPAYYVFDLISNINPDFFHLAIRSKIYVPFFAAASDGVRIGQWDLNKSRMKEIPIVVPPIKEQIKAIEHIKTQSKKIANAISQQKTQIEKLKEYKDTLIDSAVTGKIKVC